MEKRRIPFPFTIAEIAGIAGGKLYFKEEREIGSFQIDSRKVGPDDVFVAFKGERSDGHRYIGQAFEKGASVVIATALPEKIEGNLILVDDATAALGRLAAAYRKTLGMKTVGVTGSVGKTTTKQLVNGIFSRRFDTLATEGNFNNELGMPLTLLNAEGDREAAVLEMGMCARGEIEYLSLIARPEIGIITMIGTSHIEKLGSREEIRNAKMEITAGMPENGTLVLNADEPLLRNAEYRGTIVYAGFSSDADYIVSNIRPTDNGSVFDLTVKDGKTLKDLVLPVAGEHNVKNAALAIAAAFAAGLTETEVREGLAVFENTGYRQKLETVSDILLIEDCYNAARESMAAALAVLASKRKEGCRTVAVLGEMRELGSFAPDMHREVGMTAAETGVDLLLPYGGTDAAFIAEGAAEGGMNPDCILPPCPSDDPERAAEILKENLRPGDTVLFKASRALALENVIGHLKRILENNH